MPKLMSRSSALFFLFLSLCFMTNARAQGKSGQGAKAQADDDVVRINSELVQTDVTVVDKQGREVFGLGQEQFELRVNDRRQPISLFETVTLGNAGQERRPANARQDSASQLAVNPKSPATTAQAERGRTIFFFIDDVHISAENLIRARQALLKFIEEDLGQNDQAAIVSASGQVGFLQQLTGNKAVLRAAIARLDNKRNPETYAGKVPISEFDAAQVAEAHNRELFRYLVEATAAEFQMDELNAANMVKNRVQQIAMQSRAATNNTLYALEGLMRSSAPLAGRKLIFFISDGFVADPRSSNILERLKQVARTAAQVGAVIYTMDARGTFVNTYTDATQNLYPDYTGSVSRNVFAEGVATQEPLTTLAEDTGGRAILNSNSFGDGFRRALDESSSYYLLAWRPETEAERAGKARITVGIKGRPDLKVRVRRGVIERPRAASLKPRKSAGANAPNAPDEELLAALGSLYPVRDLPVTLSAGFMNTQSAGTQLVASMQIETDALRETLNLESQKAELDVMGVALDDRGSIYSFKQKLAIPAGAIAEKERRPFIWNQQLSIAPGLYQVRVAVRDRTTGRTGSALQWIEIPSVTQDDFYMSSIFVGEIMNKSRSGEKAATIQRSVPVSVDRRLASGSTLRFQTYIYNAARAAADSPDVTLQVRILQNGQTVLVLPEAKLETKGATDFSRLPYSGEVALNLLPAGSYVLQISAADRLTGRNASQQINFTVR